MTIIYCACGLPLHYNDKSLERYVQKQVDELGPDITVTIDENNSWLVPRHYIALHGIKAVELPTLGFLKVKNEKEFN